MNYLCPICASPVDEFGNVLAAVTGDQTQPVQPITCIACRLEAIRVKQYGPKTIPKERATYQQLPYKD